MAGASLLAGATLTALFCATPAAWGQTHLGLAEAQKAYAEVDYERTYRLALNAIKQGGNDHATTSELYLLWATAAAASDASEEARNAFLYALVSNPTFTLDRGLSPKIRAPYLEARGSVVSADGRPPLEVSIRRSQQELELTLRDPLHVAAAVELATRVQGEDAFSRRRWDAVSQKRVPGESAKELQFFVHVLDRYGNVLLELGSEDEPQRLLQVRSTAPVAARAHEGSALAYYVTAGTLAGLGVAAGSMAGVMYLRREDRARAWNGPGCEQPGATRYEQCSAIDAQRESAQLLSIGFGAAAGGLVLGSLITLLLTPSAHETSVALDSTSTQVMLRLRTRL